MASERKGKVYESIVFALLSELVDDGVLSGPVHWDVKPQGMSINTDFTFGVNPDQPTMVMLLSHSGAAGNSHMKCWRNLGELVEAKTLLDQIPSVFALTFGAIKEDLAPIQDAAFDGYCWVTARPPTKYRAPHRWLASQPWAALLDLWVDSLVPVLPKKRLRADWARDLVSSLKPKERKATGVQSLRELLRDLLSRRNTQLAPVWSSLRARAVPSSIGARATHFKRGFGKLYLLEERYRRQALEGKREWRRASSHGGPIMLGVLRPRIGNLVDINPADREATFLVDRSHTSEVIALRDYRPPAGVDVLRAQSLAISNLEAMVNAVRQYRKQLVTPAGFLEALKEQYKDPCHLLTKASTAEDVWLFRVTCELLRVHLGNKRQSYGYATMVRDIRSELLDKSLPAWLLTEFGSDGRVFARSAEPIRRGLQDFLNRQPGARISNLQLGIVAWVLAKRLQTIADAAFSVIEKHLLEGWKSGVCEARYLSHRYLDPVGFLLSRVVPGFTDSKVASCFAQAGGVTSASAKMEVGIAGSTIINWQSATDQGRDHKKKELCGRAVALRYAWDGKTFRKRPGVSKLILVLDGLWDQEDIHALLRAGWDEIFYPDEMDRLVSLIS